MISRFFINRPIFASVLSIVITLAGAISVFTLPLAQFPEIAPPTVQVSCMFPGASAKEVSDAVAAPIEQQVNGVEGIMYMSSQSANDGSYNLTVTFQPGIDLDMAQVLVQNRVNLAVPQLPEVIRATGVTTMKRSSSILLGLAVNSPNRRYDQLYLSNYALMQIKDELARLNGVGEVMLFGQRDYSMRIWIDPDKLQSRRLSAGDVVQAIREQNAPVAAGSVGQEPAGDGQSSQVVLSTLGRLAEAEQFEDIIVKTDAEGRVTRIRDVGRAELGAKTENINVRLDGEETVFLAIFQTPDANALDLRQRVLDKMDELAEAFPEGIHWEIGFDTTPYTRESINEVVHALRDSVILVAIVVMLFLQSWRSAIIPLVAVPVAIVGTFAVMASIGFSLNNLTLFGLVLAIGIVVDDAIVVVEAVEHHIEHGLSPRAATFAAMEQVSGPVIAVGLVLSAVFIPCAFITGITGAFFRQFALTIAVSTIISAFNSLTLSPALTAILLRPRSEDESSPPLPRLAFPLIGAWIGWSLLGPWIEAQAAAGPLAGWGVSPTGWKIAGAALAAALLHFVGRPLNRILGALFRAFNRGFSRATTGYVAFVGKAIRASVVALLIYGGLLGLTWWQFQRVPRGFIPQQDMGWMIISAQLPDSASLERTEQVMRQIEKIGLETQGIRHVAAVGGMSFALGAQGSNFGSLFVGLKDYSERRTKETSSDYIKDELQQRFSTEIADAQVFVFAPPPVMGVGTAGGFKIVIEDRADAGPARMQEQVESLVEKASKSGKIYGFTSFRANVPQMRIDPDLGACMLRGVSLQDFADTLGVYEGAVYVNDFNRFGRTWQVIVQAEGDFREQPEDVAQLKVRNSRGAMVPIGSLAELKEVNGPLVLQRYNMYPAAAINGGTLPGVSSGEGSDLMQALARAELPASMSYEWTEMSYLEQLAGNTAMVIFAFAVVMVFLVLAAQYESWSLPLAVILVVPMCVLSALIGITIAGKDMNIFTQIGFVVLVGLASKNAILIVEFAKQQRVGGVPRRQATLKACRLRLRPIVMTSFAFILGVVPLIFAHGAGAEMRQALGTAVFSGMLGVTLFGLALTPVFFYTIDWLGDSSPFASPTIRRFGGTLLDWLRLGPVLRGVKAGFTQLSRARSKDRSPSHPIRTTSSNGHPEPQSAHGSNGAHDGNGTSQTESKVIAPTRKDK